MTPEIAECLAVLVTAILLFAWDRIPADVVALGVLLAVTALNLITTDQAFAGFGSGTVIMILGLFYHDRGPVPYGNSGFGGTIHPEPCR